MSKGLRVWDVRIEAADMPSLVALLRGASEHCKTTALYPGGTVIEHNVGTYPYMDDKGRFRMKIEEVNYE